MSVLDFSGGKKGHRLSRMKIREVSLVDHAASPGADIVLAKSRDGDMTFSFQPIMIQKSEADYDDGVSPADLERRKQIRKAYRKQLRKTLRRRFGKADRDFTDGMSGGGFHSESDRVGAQDARDDQEHADDTAAIQNEILRSPPVHSETWTQFSLRIFGASALRLFTSDELIAARDMFNLLKGSLKTKALAAEALDHMAKRRAADGGMTYEKAYAEVAKSAEGSKLYGVMRENIMKDAYGAMSTDGINDDDRAVRTLSAGPSNRRNMVADAASLSPQQCLDAINAHADHIQSEMPGCSRSSAILMAGSALPAHYAKSRGARGQ